MEDTGENDSAVFTRTIKLISNRAKQLNNRRQENAGAINHIRNHGEQLIQFFKPMFVFFGILKQADPRHLVLQNLSPLL